ncbi:MAG: hypothetical protein WC359_10785 [Dehalococcoidia bacterium]|jgi:hypothetical protein
MGFTLAPDISKFIESYILLFILFVAAPKSLNKLSTIFVWLLMLLSYVPMLTYFALANGDRLYIYAVSFFWLITIFIVRLPVPGIRLRPIRQSTIIMYLLFICFGLTTLYLIWQYLGLSLKFDLTGVYDIRSAYKQAQIPMAGYLFSWMAKVINPVLFAIFILKKKWAPAALTVLLQLLLYSATGHKTYFYILPFVLVLMWIVTRKNALSNINIMLTGIIAIGILAYWWTGHIWISSLITNRTLLLPAQISFDYYDFFSHNELVYLSDSRLGFFADYPYELPPPYLIGKIYFGNPNTSANTGIYGDAYMNFGFAGLAIYSIILGIIFKIVDLCSRRLDLRLGVAAIAASTISLTNGALTTAFLTGGLWLVIVMLYFLPKSGPDSAPKKEARAACEASIESGRRLIFKDRL